MNKRTTIALLGAVTFCGLLQLSGCMRVPEEKVVTKTKVVGPDVETVIRTSISSIQAQNQLLVMTSKLNGVATSDVSRMGMDAKQTDIVSADIQYRVDLSRVNAGMVKSDQQGLSITLPRDLMILDRMPANTHETYDNNSWLFSVNSDTRAELMRANTIKIQASFKSQSENLRGLAEQNARQSIQSLFEIPLKAAGLDKKVSVSFL